MHICVTHVDARTGVPCDVAPMRKGPAFPDVKGLSIQWFNQSEWPTDKPLFYGTCDDDTDLTVPGIVSVLSEQEYTTLWDNEKATIDDQKRKAINSERDRRIDAGFAWGGYTFQSDKDSRENITGASTSAVSYIVGGGSPDEVYWQSPDVPFVWIAMDNAEVQMTPAQMIDFGNTAMAHKKAHIFAARTLKDMATIPQDFNADKYWP